MQLIISQVYDKKRASKDMAEWKRNIHGKTKGNQFSSIIDDEHITLEERNLMPPISILQVNIPLPCKMTWYIVCNYRFCYK